MFLSSQDAQEVIESSLADFTDATLVNEDAF